MNLLVQLPLKYVLPDLLDKMRTFSIMFRRHREFSGPASFKITDLLDLLDKTRTFFHMLGPYREFIVPTIFEITVLPDF